MPNGNARTVKCWCVTIPHVINNRGMCRGTVGEPAGKGTTGRVIMSLTKGSFGTQEETGEEPAAIDAPGNK